MIDPSEKNAPLPDRARDYAIGTRAHVPRAKVRSFDVDERSPPESLPPQSSWMFHTSVYLFPFRNGVLSRWLLISAGITPGLVLLALMTVWSAHESGGPFVAQFGLSIIGLPLFMLMLGTAVYATSVFLHVVEATAGGADTIENWPDADWTEWLGQCIHLVYAVGVAVGASFGIGWYSSAALLWLVPSTDSAFSRGVRDFVIGVEFPVLLSVALFYFVLPIVLISTQHGSFGWLPLTRSVCRSLVRPETERDWAYFWIAGLPLFFLPFAQLAFAPPRELVLAAAGLGPQLAAALLIYGRLLGRLGWEIGEHLPDEPESEDDDADDDPRARDSKAWMEAHRKNTSVQNQGNPARDTKNRAGRNRPQRPSSDEGTFFV